MPQASDNFLVELAFEGADNANEVAPEHDRRLAVTTARSTKAAKDLFVGLP